jgi:hypothetical protein
MLQQRLPWVFHRFSLSLMTDAVLLFGKFLEPPSNLGLRREAVVEGVRSQVNPNAASGSRSTTGNRFTPA